MFLEENKKWKLNDTACNHFLHQFWNRTEKLYKCNVVPMLVIDAPEKISTKPNETSQ